MEKRQKGGAQALLKVPVGQGSDPSSRGVGTPTFFISR